MASELAFHDFDPEPGAPGNFERATRTENERRVDEVFPVIAVARR